MLEENSAVSLVFYGPKNVLEELHLALGGKVHERGHWSMRWKIGEDATPEAVIARAAHFLASNVSKLVGPASSCDVAFIFSWTPHDFQDSVAFESALVNNLGKLSATIVVDTYS